MLLSIRECNDGQIATSHLQFLEPLSCIRVGGEGLIIGFSKSLWVVGLVGGVLRPWFLTEVACILVELFGVVMGYSSGH